MTYTVNLPIVIYTTQPYWFHIDSAASDHEYRILYTLNNSWQYSPFSATGTEFFETASTQWISVGAQSRPVGSTTQDSNLFIGQTQVLNYSAVTGLLDSPYEGRLHIHEFDSNVSAQASDGAWRAGISSWQGLSTFVESMFVAAGNTLPFGNETARALYYMQWVSGLWSYGNLEHPELAGCVTSNEITGTIDPASVSVRTFLDSPIGCCTDYTTVLSYLLESAGIETRIITGLGHVFIEAKLDGAWWSLDANLNLAYQAPADQVLDVSRDVEIYRFQHAGMTEGSSIYRDSLVDFLHYHLKEVEFGHFEQGYRRDTLTFYNTLNYGQTFTSELDTIGWVGTGGSGSATGYAAHGWTVGDFNGDGLTDAFTPISGLLGASMRLTTADGFADATVWSSNANPGSSFLWLVGDFNGDGRDDLLADRGEGMSAMVRLSDGTSFGAESSWTTVTSGDWGWWAGDFNGDGRTDVMRLVNGVSGADVYLSDGTGFVSAGSWTDAGSGSQRWYVGDFNGDGRDDLVRQSQGVGTEVFLSTGSSFTFAGLWSTAGQAAAGTWYVGDFNGDGRDDLGRRTSDGYLQALLSDGTRFDSLMTVPGDPISTSRSIQIGDFDGDATSDLFFSRDTFLDGGIQALGNTADYNGLTTAEMVRAIPTTYSRLFESEIDSTVSALGASVDLASINSLFALHAAVARAYDLHAGAVDLASFSDATARVMFEAQWLSGLSLFGAAGSEAEVLGEQSIKATLLASFLEHDGLDSYIVTTSGFTINEVQVDSNWWSIVAAAGIAFEGRWNDVIDTALSPRTYIFDVDAMNGLSTNYSPYEWTVQESVLMHAGTGIAYDFDRVASVDWLSRMSSSFAPFVDLPMTSAMTSSWTAPSRNSAKWYTGDFDGDGSGDLMSTVGTSTATVALSNGSGFDTGTLWTSSSSGNQGWYIGDFNGDGMTDIFAVISKVSGAQMHLSNGATFIDGGSWTTAGSGAQRWYVADYNGDGCDDLLRYITGVSGAQVMLSTGSSFTGPVSWTGAGQGSGGRWYIGDYDGDGRADLGRVLNGAGFQVISSTGSFFGGVHTWLSGVSSTDRLDIADVNGDGLADLVVRTPSTAAIHLYLSTGSSFVAADWSGLSYSTAALLFGDFDGNGSADLALFSSSTAPLEVHLTKTVISADTFTATDDADVFIFSASFGHDTIKGFSVNGHFADQIALADGLASSFADVIAHASQVGHDTVIAFEDSSVLTLREVDMNGLTSYNFLL